MRFTGMYDPFQDNVLNGPIVAFEELDTASSETIHIRDSYWAMLRCCPLANNHDKRENSRKFQPRFEETLY